MICLHSRFFLSTDRNCFQNNKPVISLGRIEALGAVSGNRRPLSMYIVSGELDSGLSGIKWLA